MKKNNTEFIVKDMTSCEGLMLKDTNNLNGNALCSIDENEVLSMKGCIKLQNIEKVTFTETSNKTTFYISVRENKQWNEHNEKKHPIRWKLGLIHKSTPETFDIGFTKDKESIEKLSNIFKKYNVPITYDK